MSKEVDDAFWESINEQTHTDIMNIVISFAEKRITAGKVMELIAERCEVTRAAERARCVAAVKSVCRELSISPLESQQVISDKTTEDRLSFTQQRRNVLVRNVRDAILAAIRVDEGDD